MNSVSLATLFLPAWALPWVMVLAAAAWIAGARALAGMAAMVVVADVLIAPLLAPLVIGLPDWAFLLMLAVFALAVLHQMVTTLFGRETAGHVTGSIVLATLRLVLLWPFWLLGFVIRLGAQGRR